MRAQRDRDRRIDACQLLHDHRVVLCAAAGAAVLLRERDAHQVELAELANDLVREFVVTVELLGHGCDLGPSELAHRVAQQLLVCGEFEVHAAQYDQARLRGTKLKPKGASLAQDRDPVHRADADRQARRRPVESVDATELGGTAIRAALERAEVAPEQVEHVVMGQVLQAGQGQIPSRQAQIKARDPEGGLFGDDQQGLCVRACAPSGCSTRRSAPASLRSASRGGMESMSNAPYLLKGARFGLPHG